MKIQEGSRSLSVVAEKAHRVRISQGDVYIDLMWDEKTKSFRVSTDGALLVMPTAANSLMMRPDNIDVWRD